MSDYEFQLDTGPILNSDVVMPFTDITLVRGVDSADVRETERDWEGNNGTFLDAEFEKGRRIVLQGSAYGTQDNLEAYLDSLKENWAPRRDLTSFYFQP